MAAGSCKVRHTIPGGICGIKECNVFYLSFGAVFRRLPMRMRRRLKFKPLTEDTGREETSTAERLRPWLSELERRLWPASRLEWRRLCRPMKRRPQMSPVCRKMPLKVLSKSLVGKKGHRLRVRHRNRWVSRSQQKLPLRSLLPSSRLERKLLLWKRSHLKKLKNLL